MEKQEASKAKRGRFIIEGEWLGYRSSQDRIVHRKVYPASRKNLRLWAQTTYAIVYTDGTRLRLTMRDCKPRERVEEINGYGTLIESCALHGVSTVQALLDIEDKSRAPSPTQEGAK